MKNRVRLIGGLLIALLALTQYTSAQQPAINARMIEDRDHVTVMELTGAYDRQPEATSAYEENIRKAIAREFLRLHQDDYDFIVSFSNFPFNLGSDEEGTRVGGRYYAIKNDVQGIGQAQFDHSAEWGSTGRLQGYIDMGHLGALVTDPTDPKFETTLSTLSHEVAHRWSAHLRFQNPDGTPNSGLLGAQGAHWSFFLQSHNSVLYGNDWHDNGNGTFTSVGRSRSYYSPLDLYAMGVIARSEVPPFFLIENAAGNPARLPEVGVTITGTPRAITIEDVIAAEGARIPDAESAPKQFKIAFVFLVRPGENADGGQLRAINNIRQAFATRMLILTGGRALVEVFPDVPDAPVGDPDRILPPSSGPRTAAVDLSQGINWLLSRQATNGGFADSPSTAVRDTAAAIDLLSGAPAAFASKQAALGWLSALQDASNVDTVSRRIQAIAPQFSPADNAFLLAARHASGGWGLRAGDEIDPFDTALALAVVQGADPTAAITRLVESQLPDGSWPLHLGGPGSILATATVLRLAGRFSAAPFNQALARAATWLETRQNSDGGFGELGSTAYETALAIVHASRVASTTIDVRWAVEYLRRGQLADGSWNESVYETALAILALQLGDLPNVALVSGSLAFSPASPIEGEAVTVSAQLANSGSRDLSNVVVRFYDGHPASGGLPISDDVIVASLPAQARVSVNAVWDTSDAAGQHEIVAIADPGFAFNESNEADNTLSGPLAVRPPPQGADLAIAAADISFSPGQVSGLPQVQSVHARIANLGRTAVPNAHVAVYGGDPAAGAAQVGEAAIDVPARGSANVTITFTIAAPGERRYFVVADPAAVVTEADEANNVASRILTVQPVFDLFVTPGSIALSENPIALGRDLQISAQVGNSGTADAFASRVRVFINDPAGVIEIATLTMDLPAGQTRAIAATWRSSRALASAPLVIQVDPLNAFSEASEANNQESLALTVPASTEANLRLSHQELEIGSPILQGGTTTIRIPVHNTGFADASNVNVTFYSGTPGAGGALIGQPQTIANLPAGGTAVASVVWDSITTFGDKVIHAVVDPGGAIAEFDEQDNTAFVTVDVLSLPDLAVSSASLSFSPPFPRTGEPVQINALISNLGEQAANNVSVQLFLGQPSAGGMPIGAAQFVSVEGGAFASVHATMDSLTVGVSTIFVVVDAANQVPELNDGNNVASRIIGVQDGSFYFTNPYFSPNGDEVQDTTDFFFRLTSVSASAVQAIDRAGRVVREFALAEAAPSGNVQWDGRTDLGQIAADGEYTFALIDATSMRLASATVVLDNNRLPVTEALGTEFLLDDNLTCDATGPVSGAQFANPMPPFTTAGWLANDAGLVQIVPTQMICPAGTFFYFRCAFQYVTSPAAGVYITTPDGQSRTRITPDSWTANAYTGAQGTMVNAALPSPTGERIAVTIRKYTVCCPFFPSFQYLLEYVGPAEVWVLNSDGSGLRLLGSFAGPLNTSAGVHDPELHWSPDGEHLAVNMPNDGTHSRLYTIDVRGGGPVLIDEFALGGAGGIHTVEWTPGSRLVYAKQDSAGVNVWQSINADGSGRITLAPGDRGFYPNPASAMWLGDDRFANVLFDGRNQLWLLSTIGEQPRLLSTNVSGVAEAAGSPERRVIGYTDTDPNNPSRRSTGIWLVDVEGGISQLYRATDQNLGIRDLRWNADGSRLVFFEKVVSNYRVCVVNTEVGPQEMFCGDASDTLRVVDIHDGASRVIPTPTDQIFIQGVFPDGNAILATRWDGNTNWLVAISLIDGVERTILDARDAAVHSDANRSHLGFTPSGRYLIYGRFLLPGAPCYASFKSFDTHALSSLLNLTADFTFQRDQSQLVIRGTAQDRNFDSYILEAASVATPDQWTLIAPPGDAPVTNQVLAQWIPPSEGTFLVRLTATDKAGNRASTRRRVTWGLTPSITNVVVSPRVFSPDGNGIKDSTAVDYVVLAPANLEFTIVNAQNTVVRTITQSHPAIGPASLSWNGRNDAGEIVPDGVYRIRVLDFSFFVTVDNTAPDARLSIGSAFRTFAGAASVGPLVDMPVHELIGRAVDVNLASWSIDVGIGANPAEWILVDQGANPLLALDVQRNPIVPTADTAVRLIQNASDVVGKRFRLRIIDQAGNTSIAVTDFAPEEIILHKFDAQSVPTTTVIEQSLGAHVLAVEQTVRTVLQSVRVQTRLQGSQAWIDGVTILSPARQFDLPWNNSALGGGRIYEVRIAGRDGDGVEYFSNVARIHSDLFELTDVDVDQLTRQSSVDGVASLREELNDVRLVLVAPGDPDIGIGPGDFFTDVFFRIFVATNPALDGCSSELVRARFKGVGASGRVYYSQPFDVTRFGPANKPCSSTSTGVVIELTATRLMPAECGVANPERVLIAMTATGYAPGTLRLRMQDVPNGLFRELPNISSPFALDLDTTARPEGTYLIQASAVPAATPGGSPVSVTARFVVDRAPPTAQITYPAANTMVCPVRTGSSAVIPIEGIAEDASFDHYSLSYGAGDDPQLWTQIFPLTLGDVQFSRTQRRGLLHEWDVRQLGAGTYTLCLKVFDQGGNAVCHRTTFSIPAGAPVSNVRTDAPFLSPNGDGAFDSAAITFTLDAPALVTARVYAVVNGQRAPTPIRTLFANAQQLAGSNTVLWNGFTDLAVPAVDGEYQVVVSALDGCGNNVESFVSLIVDSLAPEAVINVPQPGPIDRIVVETRGTADDHHFENYRLEVGEGAAPTVWTVIAQGRAPLRDALLGQWNNRGTSGQFTLRLTASDAAGNIGQYSTTVVVAVAPPLVESLSASPLVFSPNGDGRADSATLSFTTTAPVRISVDILRHDDTVVSTLTTGADFQPGMHTLPWSGLDQSSAALPDGEYRVRVTATSLSDSSRVQAEHLAIVIDTTPPLMSLTTPLENTYVRGDVEIAGGLSDVNISGYEVRYGTAATGPTILLNEGGQNRHAYSFGVLRGLADGAHVVRVSVTDRAQNTTTVDRHFFIDALSPAVALTSPATGAIAGGDHNVFDVRGSVLEPNLAEWTLRYGAGLDPAAWTALVTQGTPPVGDQLLAWDTTSVSDGIYTLSLVAVDRAGGNSEVRVQVAIDHTPPVAVIRLPADGAQVSAAQTIRGDVTDVNFVRARLEFSEGPASSAFQFSTVAEFDAPLVDAALWELALPSDGAYTLRLTVEDAAGQITERLSSFIVDTTPPVPPANLVASLQNRRNAHLSWSAAGDAAGYHVYRGGQRLTATPIAQTTYADNSLSDGTHRYTVTSVEASGLESNRSNEASVVVDLTAPAANIQSPGNGAFVADVIEVRGTASSAADFREYRVLVGDGAAPTSLTLVRRSPVPMVSGVLAQVDTLGRATGSIVTIRLEAEDFDGNVAADAISVTIDDVTPAAPVLLAVTSSGSTATSSWQAGGGDDDIAGYLVYRDGLIAQAGRVVNGSIGPYLVAGPSFADSGLIDGEHEYYVVAVDRAGNISAPSNHIAVIVEARAPRATIVSPADGLHSDRVPITLIATSGDPDVANVQFQVRRNLTSVWNDIGAADMTAPYSATWDPAELPYDLYFLRAVATDVRGNTDTAPPSISILLRDLTPPAPPTDLTAIVNGSSVSLNWTATTTTTAVAGYRVSREFGGSGLLTTTSFTEIDVPQGFYNYFVEAVDTVGNASRSNVVQVLVYAPNLSAPSVCLGEPVTSILGTFAKAFGTVTLHRRTSSGLTALQSVEAGADGEFAFAGVTLSPGNNLFTAQVLDSAGNRSLFSTDITITFSDPPEAASDLAATVNDRDVFLTWTAAARASTYQVLRGTIDVTTSREVAGTGTASASSTLHEEYAASNAIDGDEDTFWFSANPPEAAPWWQEDFAMPVDLTDITIAWYPGLQPRDFNVQHWDGTQWITLHSVVNNTLLNSVIAFDAPIHVSRLRINITRAAFDGYPSLIREVRMLRLANSEVDRGAPNGRHTYTVSGVNACGVSGPPVEIEVAVGDVTPPNAPTNLVAVVTNSDVLLAWTAASGADSYRVERRLGTGDWQIAAVSHVATAVDLQRANGLYRYRVIALDLAGNESAPSNEAEAMVNVAPPAAPAALVVTAPAIGAALDLSWNASGVAPTAFGVFRHLAGETPSPVALTAVGAVSYRDTGLINGETYFYVVRGVDAAGNTGDASNEASGIPLDSSAPAAPILSNPTDAAHPQTLLENITPIGGLAEPNATVTLVRSGVAIGTATAQSELSVATFEFEAEPETALAFDAGTSQAAAWIQNRNGAYSPAIAVTDLRTRQSKYFGEFNLITDPVFIDNGAAVAYGAFGGDSYVLKTLNVTTGSSAGSIELNRFPAAVAATADGSRVAVKSFDPETGINQFWLVNRVTGATTAVTHETQDVDEGAWSRDGRWFVYTLADGTLGLTAPDTGETRHVDVEVDLPVFSPDGSRLVLEIEGVSGTDIWFYDIQSEQLTQLSPEQAPTEERRGARFSVDGALLAYFVEPAGDSPTVVRVRNLSTGASFEIAVEEDDLFWAADGSLFVVDNDEVTQVRMPGQFHFESVELDPGLNLISAIATDAAGNESAPALPIALTLATSNLSDLTIREQDVVFYPQIPAPGAAVHVSAIVRNAGAAAANGVTVQFFDVDDHGVATPIGAARALGSIAAGGQASAAVDWTAIAGRRRLRARVDPLGLIAEASEANNTAERSIDVVQPGVPVVRIATDRSAYGPSQVVQLAIAAVNPAVAANFTLRVTIEDALGNVAATALDLPLANFGYSSRDLAATWSTGDSLAGDYRARATLHRSDGTPVTAITPFSISADEHVAVSISTDRSSYGVGDVAQFSGVVQNASANVVLSNVLATVSVHDAQGAELQRVDTPIETLLIGSQIAATAQWQTLAPGTYTARITARQGSRLLGEASRTFGVTGVVQLSGTVQPSTTRVAIGQSVTVAARAVNSGSVAASGVTLRIRLAETQSNTVVRTFERNVDLNLGAPVPWDVTVDTTGLGLRSYTLIFEGDRAGAVTPFATATFSIVDVVAPTVQVSSPAADLTTDTDVVVVARATDDASAVVRVDVRVDGAGWQQMTLADASAGIHTHRIVVAPLTDGTHTIEVRAIDAAGNDDTTSSADQNPSGRSFRIERNGQNRAPQTSDQALTVDEDAFVAVVIAASDPDLDPLTYQVGPAQHGTVTGTAPQLVYRPAANYHGADAFDVIVRDSGGLSAAAHVSITVRPVNDQPLAIAGADQTVVEGDLVTLDGSASQDIDGNSLSYRWMQIDGPLVVLDLTNPARPTFVAPEVSRSGGTLLFHLMVNDGAIDSPIAVTRVVVTNVNRGPAANDLSVSTDEDTAVTFTIEAADPDDDSLTFSVQPPLHGVVSGDGPVFTYTPAVDFHGADQFQIVVQDPAGLSATAHVQVAVIPVNDRPVANAGTNQTVQENDSVILDGTASSDLDGDVLRYAWTQIAGPIVTLDAADTAHPHFTAPDVPSGGATLTFGLVVSDDVLESSVSQVNVTIRNVNHSPVANAGPNQHVSANATVVLNGALSYDLDNDPLTFTWQQVSGVPVTLINAATATPSFAAPVVGPGSVLTFELTVSDGIASVSDLVDVTVDPQQNHAPIANAGPDQIVRPFDQVSLNGTASSDPDGDALTYRWTQTAGLPVILDDPFSPTPSFTAPRVSPLIGVTFALVVRDGLVDSAADKVTVRVVANAGGPVCSAATVSPSVLWPPNHQMVNVAIGNYSTGSGLTMHIVKVTQDEPTENTGDGDTGPDASFSGGSLLLRAERSASGNGRVYRITFSVADDANRTCQGSVLVTVPLIANTPVVDDGKIYDSTMVQTPPKK